MGNDDRGGRTRDPGHAVMFGKLVAAVAPRFRVTREVQGIVQSLSHAAAHRHRG
jgi:Flp pilus assembly CpaE family ATPase